MRGMMRFCMFVGLLALSIASCNTEQPLPPTPFVVAEGAATPIRTPTSTPATTPTVSTPMPLPAGVVKKWRLVEEVVDGETQPPFAEGMWIEISSGGGHPSCDHCNGTITFPFSDGCNQIIVGLTVADSGGFSFSGDELITMLDCVEIDPETGEVKSLIGTSRFGAPEARFGDMLRSVSRYELREGQLWLHYPNRKKALVFE